MRFDLTSIAKRPRGKRSVVLRDIVPPAMLASDLFASCYRPVVNLLQRYTARLVAEYERSLSALTTDSAADIADILDELGAELSRLVLSLTPGVRDWVLRVEKYQRGRWVAAVLSASGVHLETLLTVGDVRETLEQVLNWNVALVKDVGTQAQQRISNAVFSGLQNRSPARDVAREIREATGFARGRSLRIASDQLSKLSLALASERRLQAGLSVYEFKHSHKRHPRAIHVAMDGHLYSADKTMIGRAVDGKTVEAEMAQDLRAGRPPFCGCRELATIVWDDD